MPADQSPDAGEMQRVLDLLVHDIRAPLSVAQGYVRLLKDDQLKADSERREAFTQTMNALGRIARLCDDAARYAAEEDARPASVTVSAGAVAARVEQECSSTSAATLSFVAPTPLTGTLRVGPLQDVAEAVAGILCAVHRSVKHQPRTVLVTERHEEALFLMGTEEHHAVLQAGPLHQFDPWRGGHGIALPLACRTVTRAGGRIWTAAGLLGCVGIALPAKAIVS